MATDMPPFEEDLLVRVRDFSDKLKKVADGIVNNNLPTDPKIFLKLVKPLWVTAEQLLQELNYAVDFLNDNDREEQALQLKLMSSTLEESVTLIAAYVSKLEAEQK